MHVGRYILYRSGVDMFFCNICFKNFWTDWYGIYACKIWISCLKFCWKQQTLPEAQRTQDIESKTWIISKSRNECKFQFYTLNIPPSLVTTFSTLCTSPSSYSPTTISMTTVTSQCSNNIYCRQHDHSSPAPIFRAAPIPPPCRPPWWSPSPHWARPPSKWQPSTSNCPISIIS